MPKFSKHVALMSPEYQAANFAPGDEVPEWALDQVGAHVLEPETSEESDEADDSGDEDEASGSEPDSGDDSGQDDGGGTGKDPDPADEQPDFTAPAPRRGRSRTQKSS